MKSFTTVAFGLSALVSQVSCHYIFNTLTANGQKYATYQYIRENTNNNSPVTDLTSDDLRCNVGANGNTTATVSVAAGSTVAFTADQTVYHQGPVSVYMAKAPTTASAFDGSGDVWFKILDLGPTFSGGSATWVLNQTYTFDLPTCVQDGDYLLRIQQLAIHNPGGTPQFYIECAQITITGGGTTDLAPKVAIPGAFKATDPGYTVNIYNGFTNYTVPGPAVATC
ncbi:glycoside hydrolase family 61 protein [Coleophoma cylindrospora]|uniref:AA9 family lytic polysaccharide monooxygenase n=1 Tax=Coleophoma cylindrospora TaxID=1849047 RepID=A0A3D8S6Z7_9HELO|nr:glycoside hydrolase family 61 protein [Coleophoma cylindrospora]